VKQTSDKVQRTIYDGTSRAPIDRIPFLIAFGFVLSRVTARVQVGVASGMGSRGFVRVAVGSSRVSVGIDAATVIAGGGGFGRRAD